MSLPTELKMEKWEEKAAQMQYFYLDKLGDRDWEIYENNKRDTTNLQNKLGYLLFGLPTFQAFADTTSPDIEGGFSEINRRTAPLFQESSDGTSPGDRLCNMYQMLQVNHARSDRTRSNITQATQLVLMYSLLENGENKKKKKPSCLGVNLTRFDFINGSSNKTRVSDEKEFSDLVYINRGLSHRDITMPRQNRFSVCDKYNAESCSLNSNPSDAIDQNPASDGYLMYYPEPEKMERINGFIEKIKACSGIDSNEKNTNMYIAFIFVIAKIKGSLEEFPLIRVLQRRNGRKGDIWYFLDGTGRCYEGWEEFLERNDLPSRDYCYPKDGIYDKDQFSVEFTSLSGSRGVSGNEESNPASGCISRIWNTRMAVYHLAERSNCKEQLSDEAGSSSWYSSAPSAEVVSYANQLARSKKRSAGLLIIGLGISNAGLALLNIVHDGSKSGKNKMDVAFTAGMAVSMLFYYNTALIFKTSEIILTGIGVIKRCETELPQSDKKSFRIRVRDTTTSNSTEGNSCDVIAVRNLDDPDAYFKQPNTFKNNVSETIPGSFTRDCTHLVKGDSTADIEFTNHNSGKGFDYTLNFNSNRKIFNSWSLEFQKKLNMKTKSGFKLNEKEIFSSINGDVLQNINLLFTAIKNDASYHKIKPFLIGGTGNAKPSNPLELIDSVLNAVKRTEEAKELYAKLMKIYEHNLRKCFETVVENVSGLIEQKLSETSREGNENCTSQKRVYFRLIEVDFKAWDYLKYCLLKLGYRLPTSEEAVVIAPQRMGWLFLFFDHSIVHSAFIVVTRMTEHVEKVSCFALMKNIP